MSDPSRYEIALISGHDLPTVAELRRQILDEGVTPLSHEAARAKWLYSKNPAGPAEILGLREHGGPWVGMVAIIPRQIWIDGTEHAGAYLCDFYVHPKHRSLLPALTLQKAAKQRLEDTKRVNYTIPNEKSLPIFKRLGADQTFPRYRWARPIRYRRFLERRGVQFASVVAPMLDTLGLVFDHSMSWLKPGARAEWIEHFDERFDEFWSALPKSGVCMGARTAEYLGWRFHEEPGHNNRTLGLIERRTGRVSGYLIGEVRSSEFTIRDAVITVSSERLASLMCRALIEVRALGIAGVGLRTSGPADLLQALGHIGFRRCDPETVFIRNRPASDAPWMLTNADEDV